MFFADYQNRYTRKAGRRDSSAAWIIKENLRNIHTGDSRHMLEQRQDKVLEGFVVKSCFLDDSSFVLVYLKQGKIGGVDRVLRKL